MNKVILMGRLTRDPEIRYSQGESQRAIARYTLAVDRRGRKDGQDAQADFIRCVAFDRAAEFADKYFYQGQRVLVTGHIQTGSYRDRDGKTVYTTDVIIEDQEFADSKNTVSASDYEARSRAGSSQPGLDGFMNIPDGVDEEGLPFV